ncbi:SMI1/KNR4 family protein [Saccharomonospora xinjiangensis]|uniref:SMI1/KNR4 family protein n=1 Tax=Saccharomonospora xinjiangensis TaxID=75294 RepID=UPI00106F712D|nr:SMI1/KNR4 family protein [Saccharomonospora xinjiangensis]QBQ59895.1 SMI1 / KNR4 family protein [Saccharomonospora xinjiangensis]
MNGREDPPVERALRALAGKIAAGAPSGWRRAELRGYADGAGSGHRGFSFEPSRLNQYGSNDIDVHEELRRIADLAGTSRRLTIDVVVWAWGRFEAILSERLDRAENQHSVVYVLDHDTLPPDPGELQDGPADPTPAGDPDEAVALLGSYLRLRDRILNPDRYAPPAALPARQRARIEKGLPAALPPDLRALYSVIDGDGGEGLLARHPWFGLDEVEALSHPDNRWWVSREWQQYLSRPFVTTVGPPLTVRRMIDCPAWIPFATSTGGDFLAVDMSPGPRGRPGQVIRIGLHHNDGPTYVADSVTSLLREHVTALETGAYECVDGEFWIDLAEFRPARRQRSAFRTMRVTGGTAMRLELGPDVEALEVSDAPFVDLGPVAGTPALTRVTMRNCPAADLSPLARTPVEVLDLALDTVDLSGLEGHPVVRSLTVRTDAPLDLAPLRSCPRLYLLDLSEATDIPDIEVLGELPSLLYLNLRYDQWEALWERTSHPSTLAVAGLASEPPKEKRFWWSATNAYHPPEPSRKTVLRWTRELVGNASDVRVVTGGFNPLRRR